tara:strand:- start:585 stop:956 length:372 start_codon:yes stop_codon:yes gene_type:complete
MEKYLYFRTVTALGDDDASADSILVKASDFRGAQPTSDTTVTLFFNPVVALHDEATNAFVNSDSIVLNTGTNNAKDVFEGIARAISGIEFSSASMIVVADDVDSQYLNGIVSCGAITVAAAFS